VRRRFEVRDVIPWRLHAWEGDYDELYSNESMTEPVVLIWEDFHSGLTGKSSRFSGYSVDTDLS